MTIDRHDITLTLSVKEVSTVMVGLRMAARNSGLHIPWSSCPFLQLHKDFVRVTGFSSGDHDELLTFLKNKAEIREET